MQGMTLILYTTFRLTEFMSLFTSYQQRFHQGLAIDIIARAFPTTSLLEQYCMLCVSLIVPIQGTWHIEDWIPSFVTMTRKWSAWRKNKNLYVRSQRLVKWRQSGSNSISYAYANEAPRGVSLPSSKPTPFTSIAASLKYGSRKGCVPSCFWMTPRLITSRLPTRVSHSSNVQD